VPRPRRVAGNGARQGDGRRGGVRCAVQPEAGPGPDAGREELREERAIVASLLSPFGFFAGGGAAAPPLPSVAGLYARYSPDGPFWQDSARTTVASADGDPIGAWDDGSGSGFHLLQAVAAGRPALKLGIVNGKRVARFANHHLAAAFASRTQPVTVFMVASTAGSTTEDRKFFDAAAGPQMAHQESGGQWWVYAGGFLSGGVANDNINQHTIVFNGAGGSLRVNRAAVLAGNTGANGQQGFILGRNQGFLEPLVGDVAEILLYNAALSTTDRDAIESYLATKYGL